MYLFAPSAISPQLFPFYKKRNVTDFLLIAFSQRVRKEVCRRILQRVRLKNIYSEVDRATQEKHKGRTQ